MSIYTHPVKCFVGRKFIAAHLSEIEVVQGHLWLGVDVFQVPAETFALEVWAEIFARLQVADINISGTWSQSENSIKHTSLIF